ncbi:MAG: UDP-N-acetylmuramate dehydrogenase [Pseudomonadales bacterium]|nr:UDP-N-acetylmuramate dehydrogenase [Pseudomonadales bacterium]
MLHIELEKNLEPYNSLALPVMADEFVAVQQLDDLKQLHKNLQRQPDKPLFILGGGSNIVFQGDRRGMVIHMANRGVAIEREDDSHVWLNVQAGESWDDVVAYTLQQGYFGLENLSLIPGTVGAAPIQNIGAYGQELANCFASLQSFHVLTGEQRELQHAECEFAYRDSIFKRRQDPAWIITSVTFKLAKQYQPILDYAPLATRFAQQQPSAHAVREAVISIRQSKLPNPKRLANAGSFFKNPVLSADDFARLQQQLGDVPAYPQASGLTKVSAGFLIEKAGLKGAVSDNATVGMYAKQALVLVNHGGASARDVQDWAKFVQHAVQRRFGVALEQEPVLVP